MSVSTDEIPGQIKKVLNGSTRDAQLAGSRMGAAMSGAMGAELSRGGSTAGRRAASAVASSVSAQMGQALAGALCTSVLAVCTGITNKSLRALMTGLLGGATYTRHQASYDLARLRVNGLITRVPEKTATASPARDYGLRSSTPNCTTRSYAPYSPPTSHPPRHRYERPCTP